jgi:hypothetical protein
MSPKEKGTVRFLFQGSNFRIGQPSLPGAVYRYRNRRLLTDPDSTKPILATFSRTPFTSSIRIAAVKGPQGRFKRGQKSTKSVQGSKRLTSSTASAAALTID